MRRWPARIFFLTITLAVVGFFCLTYFQYSLWREGGPPASYLVPPYQSVGYVIGYVVGHGALPYFTSLGAAFVFLGVALWLNEKFGKRFLEDDEPYLGASAIFLLGSSLWVYYLAVMILIALLVTGYRLLVTKENLRFSLYYLWWPVAALTVIIKLLLG